MEVQTILGRHDRLPVDEPPFMQSMIASYAPRYPWITPKESSHSAVLKKIPSDCGVVHDQRCARMVSDPRKLGRVRHMPASEDDGVQLVPARLTCYVCLVR